MDTKILLENGTNELEVLEFIIDGNSYGINVAKIREIINYQEVTPVPNSHPSVEGIFMPRDTMITAIDLRNCLQRGTAKPGGLFIITNFNQLDIAFHVEAVCGIHRVSWKDILKPSSTVNNEVDGVSTGIIKIDNKLIVILDFEKIVTDISPETGLKVAEIEELGPRNRNDVPILIAEDSVLLNKLIVDSLKKAGYTNVTSTKNGKEAYDFIAECKSDGTLRSHVRCLITDIEMPEMDGHRLTKLVKDDEETNWIPVVIFSSLVNEEMRRKGEALGANAQLSKPEIGNLVKEIDKLVMGNAQVPAVAE
ncbi:MAG: chemotaxis protein [Lachnospiraceae bacterium]|nr:chemotaxis protein [Lachnospiraceae bacterium]